MELLKIISSFFKRQDRILVIGIGNGGNNIVQNVRKHINCNIGIVLLDTDKYSNKHPILLDKETHKQETAIRKLLHKKVKKVFLISCLGGNTGSNIIRSAIRIAKKRNIETICIVTTPFGFEGGKKTKKAQETINDIKPYADSLFVLKNDELMQQYSDLPLAEALAKGDSIVAELINKHIATYKQGTL